MRIVEERLRAENARACHLCRVTLRDARVFRWTDHDEDVTREGQTYRAAPGMRVSAIEKSSGLASDSASLDTVLNAPDLTEADIAAGVWDGAVIEILRADWQEAIAPLHVFTGVLGEASRGPAHFTAEVRGLQSLLDHGLGRTYSRLCDATVGDQRCGVNLEASLFKGAGSIIEAISARVFKASGLSSFADGWFSDGAFILGGISRAVETHRQEGAQALITLREAAPGLAPGAAFTIYAGCARTAETCRMKFANIPNFRGFPHMPGNDALQAQTALDQRVDGSSRFR